MSWSFLCAGLCHLAGTVKTSRERPGLELVLTAQPSMAQHAEGLQRQSWEDGGLTRGRNCFSLYGEIKRVAIGGCAHLCQPSWELQVCRVDLEMNLHLCRALGMKGSQNWLISASLGPCLVPQPSSKPSVCCWGRQEGKEQKLAAFPKPCWVLGGRQGAPWNSCH